MQGQILDGSYGDPAAGQTSFGSYTVSWQAAQVHRPTTVAQVDAHLRNHILPRHPPPHIHVHHGGDPVRVSLTGEILSGTLPRRQRRALRKWMRLHQEDLEACWGRATRQEPPGTIEPL